LGALFEAKVPSNELVTIMASRTINLTTLQPRAKPIKNGGNHDQRAMAKLSAGHIRVQPSSTIACRPNFGAYCHNLMKVRRVICIQSQKSRPLVFLHLWLFCTSPWPEHVVTYAYNNAN
jgi:hypothetical protein